MSVAGALVGLLAGACVLVVLGLAVGAVRSGGLPLAPVLALAAVALLGGLLLIVIGAQRRSRPPRTRSRRGPMPAGRWNGP